MDLADGRVPEQVTLSTHGDANPSLGARRSFDSVSLQIRQLARNKLDAFQGTIDSDGTYKDEIYLSAKSAAEHIAKDYGRRFLLELVQNAHDAHPAGDTTGEIAVVSDPLEGSSGTLYVANRGRSFRWEDVRAICRIALSNKPIGESIGNKGLGFRSVSLISDSPEIYSQSPDGNGSGFDGYCFRFARGDDFSA